MKRILSLILFMGFLVPMSGAVAAEYTFVDSKNKKSEVLKVQPGTKVFYVKVALARKLNVQPQQIHFYLKGNEADDQTRLRELLHGKKGGKIFFSVKEEEKKEAEDDEKEEKKLILKGVNKSGGEEPEVQVEVTDSLTIRQMMAEVAKRIGMKTHEVEIMDGHKKLEDMHEKVMDIKDRSDLSYKALREGDAAAEEGKDDASALHTFEIKGKKKIKKRKGRHSWGNMKPVEVKYNANTTVGEVKELIMKETGENKVYIFSERKKMHSTEKFEDLKPGENKSLHYEVM